MNEENVLNALGCLTNGALNYYKATETVMVRKRVIEDYINLLQEKNNNLQNRIDKAIEYIKHYEKIRGYYEYTENGYDEYNYEEDLQEELLDILKGDDK